MKRIVRFRGILVILIQIEVTIKEVIDHLLLSVTQVSNLVDKRK